MTSSPERQGESAEISWQATAPARSRLMFGMPHELRAIFCSWPGSAGPFRGLVDGCLPVRSGRIPLRRSSPPR